MNLKRFQEELEKQAYPDQDTRSDREKGLCLECHEPAIPKCYSDAGRREYYISGLCEKCFDDMWKEPEDEVVP